MKQQINNAWEVLDKVFNGKSPSTPEELIDGIQEFSNRTGFVGRIYGYNVKPQTNNHEILKGILLVVFACIVLAVLGYFAQ